MDSFRLEPRQIIDDFGALISEHITATVDSVIIENQGREHPLGPFEIRVDLRIAREGYFYDSLTISGDHPHISVGRPCLGNLSRAVRQAVEQKDWQALLDLCKVFLNTYFPNGAYWQLWDDVFCSSCEDYWPRDETIECDACGNIACFQCAESVQTNDELGAYLCSVCYDQSDYWCAICNCYIAGRETEAACYGCGTRVHRNCAIICESCGNQFCSSCISEKKDIAGWIYELCPDCAKSEELFCPECGLYVSDDEEHEYCVFHATYVHSSCWEEHLKGKEYEEHASDDLEEAQDEKIEKETVPFVSEALPFQIPSTVESQPLEDRCREALGLPVGGPEL